MADRVARAELHAEREQRRASREAERARAAELALVRLQDTLDHMRRRNRQTSGEACHSARQPIDIRLALPPAAAVLVLTERSLSNRSSG
jgi:hypothetical protein